MCAVSKVCVCFLAHARGRVGILPDATCGIVHVYALITHVQTYNIVAVLLWISLCHLPLGHFCTFVWCNCFMFVYVVCCVLQTAQSHVWISSHANTPMS